jgi:hypothetical protein
MTALQAESKGVKLNGILSAKFLPKNAHRTVVLVFEKPLSGKPPNVYEAAMPRSVAVYTSTLEQSGSLFASASWVHGVSEKVTFTPLLRNHSFCSARAVKTIFPNGRNP